MIPMLRMYHYYHYIADKIGCNFVWLKYLKRTPFEKIKFSTHPEEDFFWIVDCYQQQNTTLLNLYHLN